MDTAREKLATVLPSTAPRLLDLLVLLSILGNRSRMSLAWINSGLLSRTLCLGSRTIRFDFECAQAIKYGVCDEEDRGTQYARVHC